MGEQCAKKPKLTREQIETFRGLAKGLNLFNEDPDDMPLFQIREISQWLVDICNEQNGTEEFIESQDESIEPLPIDGFEEMIGRAATEKEKQLILKLQKMLGLKNNDSLWTLILALQFHLTLYNQIPDYIFNSTKNAVISAVAEIRNEGESERDRANRELSAFSVRVNNSLNSSFHELQNKAADVVTKTVNHEIVQLRKQSNWLYVSCVVTSGVFLLLGIASFVYASQRLIGG